MVRRGQAVATATMVDLEKDGDVRHLSDFTIEEGVLKAMGAQILKPPQSGGVDAHGNPTEFSVDDPRKDLSGLERCAQVEDSDPEFKEWRERTESHLRIAQGVSEEERENLIKLLFVHRAVLNVGRVCPSPIKGVKHRIVLKEGKAGFVMTNFFVTPLGNQHETW